MWIVSLQNTDYNTGKYYKLFSYGYAHVLLIILGLRKRQRKG